jgi:uncharacterized phosphosugar-binding protein
MTLLKDYRDHVVAMLDRVIATQGQALATARQWVMDAWRGDGLVYITGSGHSHMIAEEVFYRAGGAAPVQAILDPALMLHEGAQRSTRLERLEGYAATLLAGYPITAKDVLFVVSNSGRNAFPIEAALHAKSRGARTVALTSLSHAAHVTSRHGSGKKLHEVADLVLDSQAAEGDACLQIPGRDARMGSTSTIAGAFIMNALLAEAVAALAKDGVAIDVYRSANLQGTEAESEAMIERWRPRIRGL